MAESVKVGAHNCVTNPELEDAGPSMDEKYGHRRARPYWRPELPFARAGDAGMADLLVFAVAR
jgi:hypothetical protein